MTSDSKTVTIRDVAKQARVSQSTVSRVLNSSETQIPIRQETRQRVQRVAGELGYRPHPGVRSERQGHWPYRPHLEERRKVTVKGKGALVIRQGDVLAPGGKLHTCDALF